MNSSYVILEMISKNNHPFTDAEFIKKYMPVIFDEICPDKKKIENINHSSRTKKLKNKIFHQIFFHSQ